MGQRRRRTWRRRRQRGGGARPGRSRRARAPPPASLARQATPSARGEEGEASLLWICLASMILFYLIGNHPTLGIEVISGRSRILLRYAISYWKRFHLTNEDVFCSLLSGPGLFARNQAAWDWPVQAPVKHIVEGPTATNHTESPPSRPPPDHTTGGGGEPVENTKAMATALNRGLRSGIRLLAAGAEASRPGKRPSHPASPRLDLSPWGD